MGFYKNANTEIPQYEAGEDIEIGAPGKFVEIKEKDINVQYVGSKPTYHFNCSMSHISSDDPDFLKKLKADSFFNVVKSEKITQEFDHVIDRTTTFFKAVLVNERFGHFKRASTRNDIEDAYFFEIGEVITERISEEHRSYTRDTYDLYSGW